MRQTRLKWCIVAGMGMLLLGGCAGRGTENTEETAGGSMIREEAGTQEEQEKEEQKPEEQETQDQAEGWQAEAEKNHSDEAADAGAELLRFRRDREDMIHLEGEYIQMGTPNEAEYFLDFSAIQEGPAFEYEEMTAAYEAARLYVTQTLGIQPPTKCEVYMCMDPHMAEIYSDEDKGVAKGYENENIFLSEFCGEDGNWQCLVLVREGKGQPWKVIYCGNDYREEGE